ncbi:MAG: CDGSH iron-sulfur domain-containing protein [Bacteroidota bacterium]|nr:CDGSH iron-sulfur domain-containing protein [Bacteroidota bacterium]
MEPNIYKTEPTEFTVVKGKTYSWCTCGHSATNPICDGAHKQLEGMPFKSLKFTAEEDGSVWLCNCKHTKTPPFCDGTHNTLKG